MFLIRSVIAVLIIFILLGTSSGSAQQRSREAWGGAQVNVSQSDGNWIIAGKKHSVTFFPSEFSLRINTKSIEWKTVASSIDDMLVQRHREPIKLRLSEAKKITTERYDAGFKAGIKITLSGWRHKDQELDLKLFLMICLEGKDEDVVFDIAAEEGDATLRRLDWPTPLDTKEVDHTLLSNGRGQLLPRDWPKEYHPIRSITPEGKIAPTDTSEVQSNVIESWSMSWWGFQKGKSAMIVIVETPNDAAYKFEHPAGGPTVIGPRWRASLGRFAYSRTARMAFVSDGNYIQLAKRYRRYAMDTGLFVSLKEKIARTPSVKNLIGTPLTRMSILKNLSPESSRYDKSNPEKNYSLQTFDERIKQLRELKAKGLDRLHVVLTGWPYLGYDRQHPDELPPPPQAGGWEGMKLLAETCRELGYIFTLHDQYRDYYRDAPSYDPQFAIHEEDNIAPPQAFPGTRFGTWKEGYIPFMRHWDGGIQTFLNPKMMLGHMVKNYQLMIDHSIMPQGSYLDVFGYVPPDEDFNSPHRTTRTESLNARVLSYNWVRNNLGIVGTEAACDWTIPYVDISSPLSPGKAIAVPLFNLVYHDAVITPYSTRELKNALYGLLNGGLPQIWNINEGLELNPELIRKMRELHEKVATSEMLYHEFLDRNYQKERTTFSDGTIVTVDWVTNTFDVQYKQN